MIYNTYYGRLFCFESNTLIFTWNENNMIAAEFTRCVRVMYVSAYIIIIIRIKTHREKKKCFQCVKEETTEDFFFFFVNTLFFLSTTPCLVH